MSEVITTSIVVEFDAKDDGLLKIEVDGRPDGLNGGKTSFAPGDQVGLLLYKTSNVVIDAMITSLGSISSAGSDSEDKDEFVTFANVDEASSSYPISSGFSYSWFGEDLGKLVAKTETNLRATKKGVAAARLKYTTNVLQYKLINIPTSYNGLTSFPVVVFVVGHTE